MGVEIRDSSQKKAKYRAGYEFGNSYPLLKPKKPYVLRHRLACLLSVGAALLPSFSLSSVCLSPTPGADIIILALLLNKTERLRALSDNGREDCKRVWRTVTLTAGYTATRWPDPDIQTSEKSEKESAMADVRTTLGAHFCTIFALRSGVAYIQSVYARASRPCHHN